MANGFSINYDAPVNHDADLNRGLLSWWMVLPNTSRGIKLYDLKKKSDGTRVNTPLWGANFGRRGGFGSLSFVYTSSQYVNCGDIALATDKATIAFWARPTSLASTHGFLSKWNNGVSSTFLIQNSFTTGTFRVFIATAATDTATVANDVASMFVVNEWHHYVLVFDGSGADNTARLKLYRDGVLQTFTFGGTIPAALVDSSASFLIGGETSIGRYTNGNIDDVRVYNRALSASEAFNLWGASLLGYPNELNRVLRTPRKLFSAAAAAQEGATITSTDSFRLSSGFAFSDSGGMHF